MDKRYIWYLLLAAICLYVLIKGILIIGYQNAPDPEGKEFDYLIALGQGDTNAGLLPISVDNDVKGRLNMSFDIFRNQKNKPIIILSGYGAGDMERASGEIECEFMYNYLHPKISNIGYNASKYLRKECKSRDILENAIYSWEEIDGESLNILVLAPIKALKRAKNTFKVVYKEDKIKIDSLKVGEEGSSEKISRYAYQFILMLPFDKPKLFSARVFDKIYLFTDKTADFLSDFRTAFSGNLGFA